MIDPDHAKRVLEHQRKQIPQHIIAAWLSDVFGASLTQMQVSALHLIETLVKAGYAIEPIEDDDEQES